MAPNGRVRLRGGVRLDPAGEPLPGVLEFEDGRFVTAGTASTEPALDVDVTGLTLLPGLIDAHTHVGVTSMSDWSVPAAVRAAQVFRNLERCVDEGFTSIRDVGGIDGGVVEAVSRGLVRGPRILPSGPIICQTGGHGDTSSPFTVDSRAVAGGSGLFLFSVTADGPDGVRLAARRNFKVGATQLKLSGSGGIVSHSDHLEDTQFSPAELRTAVEEAESRRTYVTSHAFNNAAVRMGLEAGIRCFEHGSLLDEATAQLMADRGAALVPTLTVGRRVEAHWRTWGIPESSLARFASMNPANEEAVRLASSSGVLLGSGSDLIGEDQSGRAEEIVRRGAIQGATAALLSATRDNAEIIGLGGETGSLALGKEADLIAVKGDVLSDPRVLLDPQNVRIVFIGGRVLKDVDDRVGEPSIKEKP